jgi:hypothetical protein
MGRLEAATPAVPWRVLIAEDVADADLDAWTSAAKAGLPASANVVVVRIVDAETDHAGAA